MIIGGGKLKWLEKHDTVPLNESVERTVTKKI